MLIPLLNIVIDATPPRISGLVLFQYFFLVYGSDKHMCVCINLILRGFSCCVAIKTTGFSMLISVCEEIAAGPNPKHPLGNMIRWSGYTLDGLKHLNFWQHRRWANWFRIDRIVLSLDFSKLFFFIYSAKDWHLMDGLRQFWLESWPIG